jgi:predicted helicase
MKIIEILEEFRKIFANERDKGTAFEKIVKIYLENEPKYKEIIEKVWMWTDFPYRDNIGDTGIDLVAKTVYDEYWAIQCKFYAEDHEITKGDVDTFLATSSKYFYVDGEKRKYDYRLFASTTNYYSKNAEETLLDQDPPVGRISLETLLESQIDWKKYSPVQNVIELKDKKTPRNHQNKAIKDVLYGFKKHDRGKLIMACGTGKTFTSLRIAEEQLNGTGNVLFLVPSIALASQTLTEWAAQCRYSFNAAIVCSDNKASKGEESIDLGFPSTTDVNRLKKWADKCKYDGKEMNFIFSTYQSIDVVSNFQKMTDYHFDIIICDEAHRTTGVTLSDEDESYFVKVHDDNFIHAKKRLYMTATPRIYGDAAKGKANSVNAELCSMDDESIYGPEFYRLSFSDAVKQDLLSDYKVLVLAVDEEYVKKELQDLLKGSNHELQLEDSVKIMGCWNGLSKNSTWDEKENFVTDPLPMKRAVAFCNRIKDSQKLVEMFKTIQKHVKEDKYNPESKNLVNIDIRHVDGSFNALEKKECINWLKEDVEDGNCRILTNARCLSEGVDVPALDAVMFLNPRSSMVDIIQSVGRVMRKAEGKKYGYVILPIGISASENPDEALDKNEKYKLVWEILQALRAHDDRFNNTINKIELNKRKPDQIQVIGIGEKNTEDRDDGYKKVKINTNKKVYEGQIKIDLETFDKWKESVYAKMVKKVGSRIYWENWAKDVAEIATSHMNKMRQLINSDNPKIKNEIGNFVIGLKENLNNSITQEDAIEMLAQHMITKPVFDALFENYEFVKNNPVSKTMQKMIDILDKEMSNEEKEKLNKFHESVKERAQGIDNAEGKQRIILELYEKFFKIALPKEVDKLGIVYTPTECVDFIIHSVEYLMNKEFGKSLSNRGVHIIDGFTGTGTFIVRLLQSGVIKKGDLLYKYINDIHANEIVLLAYYIAAINIEETFHELSEKKEYTPFDGIVLTDTFQLYDNKYENNEYILDTLEENNARANRQKELPITVCIGNPPYSVGQKSQNDNAQNLKYKNLDSAIANTYVKFSMAQSNKATYDAYIRAFRWATDRIEENGIISFITNGAYIDNKGMDGFRKCLLEEFSSIYVFNLRGNQRTSGEMSKKEGGKIFGSGSRTPVAITCLIKNKNKGKDGYIHYYDIGDYLTREQKLSIIKKFENVSNIEWKMIKPDQNNDWINKKSDKFGKFIPLINKENSVFTISSSGVTTARDYWVYNFNKSSLLNNMNKMIDTYNMEVKKNLMNINDIKNSVTKDETKISWSRALLNSLRNGKEKYLDCNKVTEALYRPFCKEYFYYSLDFNECQYKTRRIFKEKNPTIIINGTSSGKDFSCLMTDKVFNFHTLSTSMAFPLYYYDDTESNQTSFMINENKYDGISNWIYEKVIEKYENKSVAKEDVFYYVYGILHSKDYRETFKFDLKKSLPSIPLVDNYEDFIKFSKSGKKLADLHLNYEKISPYKDCEIIKNNDNYKVIKMKFGKNKDKSIIQYNDNIIIKNIPSKAYEYVVNGKSAIEWIMERYAITTDKKSGIVNDPNDWCKEVNDEKYIFNLLLRIINVSVKTVDIINSLPKLNFEE